MTDSGADSPIAAEPVRYAEFEPLEALLEGRQVVVASAGTGKTHVLTRLFLRLLVERGLGIDRILVMTYTEAATGELRDRLRTFVRDAIDVARVLAASPDSTSATGVSPVAFADCAAVLRRHHDLDAARRALDSALRCFDEATVFTIHGFCQRVLGDGAFECGSPFAAAVMPDVRALVDAAVDDFWRRRFAHETEIFLAFTLRRGLTPVTLARFVRDYLDRTDLAIHTPVDDVDSAAGVERYRELWGAMRADWCAHHEKIARALESKALNGIKYQAKHQATRIEKLHALFAEGADGWLDDEAVKPLSYFAASNINAAVKKGAKFELAPLAFFSRTDEFLERRTELLTTFEAELTQIKRRALLDARDALARRKRELGVRSYFDLLGDLRAALRDLRIGPRLASALRQRHAAALIDECQDTDPVQLEILDRIWPPTADSTDERNPPVFFVGDPKQAIYGFRGADVLAFLDAVRAARRCYGLSRNWRSDEPLVQGVNALFENVPQPFVLDSIEFTPAHSAHPGRRLEITGDAGPALRLCRLVIPTSTEKRVSPGEASTHAARATAARIRELLALGDRGHAVIRDDVEPTSPTRPLRGQDIAILVRTSAQARLVRSELLELGIASVLVTQDSVLHSEEAVELHRILSAVAEPRSEGFVRAALATTLLGWDGSRIASLIDDSTDLDLDRAGTRPAAESAWPDVLASFQRWHDLWRDHGVARAVRQILLDESVAARLLSRLDGERRLTNVLHLIELLQAASRDGQVGMASLLEWLARQREAERVSADEEQLRLESDEDLVQIATIHRSKGLEYPVVLCPFLWDGKTFAERDNEVVYHRDGPGPRAVLEILSGRGWRPQTAATDATTPGTARECAVREERSESLRLTYVALTRARHLCEVLWIDAESSERSPLGWLLGSATTSSEEEDPCPEAVSRGIARLIARAGDRVAIVDLEPASTAQHPAARPADRGDGPALAARIAPRIPSAWRFASYTSLVRERADHAPSAREAEALAERPERDELASPLTTAGSGADEPSAPAGIHALEGGFRTGDCIHRIFQAIDFPAAASDGGEPGVTGDSLETLVARELERHRFDAVSWTPAVAEMVRRVLKTDLDDGGGLRLETISRRERVDELAFTLPTRSLRVSELRRALRDHGLAGGRFDASLAGLNFDDVRGYLRGSIDLVFQAQGRWHLVDWKSSRLGTSADDYDRPRVDDAMREHRYWLQYLLYSVALHRFLGCRLADYQPERHLGSIYYLFVRGMNPATGFERGVYRDALSPALVRALDRTLAGDLPRPHPDEGDT